MAKILLTRRFPENGIKLLSSKHQLDISDNPMSYEELYEKIEKYDGVVSMLSDRFDKAMIEKAKRLKIISNYAVGYDNIDMKAAKDQNITVTNTPDVLTEATAELTFALILAVSRRLLEGDRFVKDGKFKGWEPLLLLGKEVSGANLGVIGFGRIGQAVARRAKGFLMNIFYYQRNRNIDAEREYDASFLPLEELLAKSDIISINAPLNKESYHLINKERLAMIKKGAVIVNTGRGAIIDEKELANALKSGKLAGAGLDVYEYEPTVTKELLKMNNVMLLPHLGSSTVKTREKMAKMAANSIIDYFDGKKPAHIVE